VPGFAGSYDVVNAMDKGCAQLSSFRKTPAVATSTGVWFDLSMVPGNPAPNYYIGAITTATPLARSTDGGIYHGGAVSPAKKALRCLTVLSTSSNSLPLTLILCDYLLFYPFIDESTTDTQPMTNVIPLPRYTGGAGVQMMAVVVAAQTGGQTFQVTYTNQDGIAGRLTPVITQNAIGFNGTLVSTDRARAGCAGPFLPLQEGDSGVRSIDSVQMISGTDVGLFTLVLVKPLATTQLREQTAAVEKDYLTDFASLPLVQDDAYLNLLALPTGSMSGVSIHGITSFVWN